MKKLFTSIIITGSFLLLAAGSNAQDSIKANPAKHINKSNEHADNLNGKKIQQQTLTKNSFEKLDSVAVKPRKKNKNKRKH